MSNQMICGAGFAMKAWELAHERTKHCPVTGRYGHHLRKLEYKRIIDKAYESWICEQHTRPDLGCIMVKL